jgi:Chaperone of endosialidase
MKTTIRLFFALLALFSLFAAGREADAISPPPDGGYPNFTTAEGQKALFSLTTGAANTAVGWFSLQSLTTGSFNTATGAGALLFNTADANTAFGAAALLSNTIGLDNTAIGAAALSSNTEGAGNTATGFQALYSNTAGLANTANGSLALQGNTTGIFNTAIGNGALFSNTSGGDNVAIGRAALQSNTTGLKNTAIGSNAGFNITGTGNVCIGEGMLGVAGEFNTTWIRNINNTVQPVVGTDPDNVTVNSAGRLGRGNVSSRRYKHDIKPMDNASEAVLALKPVTFRYNKEYDATQTLAYGLIAEDVAQVYPDLVGRNPEGEPESVRYEQVNAMLLNEFLKEHRKVEKLEATVADLAEQLQKISAQVEMGSSVVKVAAK